MYLTTRADGVTPSLYPVPSTSKRGPLSDQKLFLGCCGIAAGSLPYSFEQNSTLVLFWSHIFIQKNFKPIEKWKD